MVDHIDKTGRSKGSKSRTIQKLILEINELNNYFSDNNKNKILNSNSNSNSNSNNYRKQLEKRRNRLNRVLKKLTTGTGKSPPPPKKLTTGTGKPPPPPKKLTTGKPPPPPKKNNKKNNKK